jgi:hypothetical protein
MQRQIENKKEEKQLNNQSLMPPKTRSSMIQLMKWKKLTVAVF